VARDDEFIDGLIPKLEAFWVQNVLAKVPPVPTGHEADGRAVRLENPHAGEGPMKPATPEQEQLVRLLKLARTNAAATKLAEEDAKNKVIRIIGDAPGLVGSFGVITYKQDKPKTTTDWEAVAATQENLIEELLLLANPGDDEDAVRRLARVASVRETLPGLYTVTLPGSRRFICKFEEDEE